MPTTSSKGKAAPETRYQVSDSALRILRIVRRLDSRWHSIRQLAAIHRVDEKTIRRDLAVIRQAGFKLQFRIEDHGRRNYRMAK